MQEHTPMSPSSIDEVVNDGAGVELPDGVLPDGLL